MAQDSRELRPSADAAQAYEISIQSRRRADEVRRLAEVEATQLEETIERNHFADKLKALIYGRQT